MDDDELEILEQFIQEAHARLECRRRLRESNSQDNIQYPSEDFLNNLDSSIKKNAAFVKKLKVFTEGQKDNLLNEIDRLNLSKFISEVASSIIETKPRLNDIPALVEICSKLNRTYREFSKQLLQQYVKYLPAVRRTVTGAKHPIQSGSSSTALAPAKLKTDLRLFAELITSGIFSPKDGLPTLINFLCYLMVFDKNNYQNAGAILTFCRCSGDDLLGWAPARIKELARKHNKTLPSSDLLPLKRQELLKVYILEYYQSLSNHLNSKLMQLSISNPLHKSKELCEAKHECLRIHNNLSQLAETLGEVAPSLPDFEGLKDESDNEAEATLDSGTSSSWDDEGTRSFYEDLLDLRALFPDLIVKASASGEKVADESDKSSSSSEEESISEIAPQSVANRVQPDQYFAKLSNCVNRDMIDNAAIDFIRFFNTKFGRRKLVKTLFNVQRTRLDLLPFYARLTATIYPYVKSVANELVTMLKVDFKNLFKKKDQINIESKVKNVRFIGELVKFNLYPKQEAITCLKMLLSDFTHHHIEMTCNLLETCGHLLYKSSESHHQIRLLLEQMMRKKLLLSVDSKYITMIENAYYFTNPPEVIKHVIEEPPVHIYVRYLLCERLDRSNIDYVLHKIEKLDWCDKSLTKFVINCMIEAYNLKFYNIRYLAALLAALKKEHQWISVAVIDGVVEDILLMMEVNDLHFNQRRIPMIRYFGELYNYRLSDSSLVFKILYSLITYGVHYPEPGHTLTQIPMSQLDLPDNLFRIKLVCDLLETCGQYLSSGQDKKKLDCYLLFFQRYYWCKKHIYMLHPYCMDKSGNQFPAAIEYLYNDAIYNLRPTFQMATSYSNAIQSVQNFIDNLIATQAN